MARWALGFGVLHSMMVMAVAFIPG